MPGLPRLPAADKVAPSALMGPPGTAGRISTELIERPSIKPVIVVAVPRLNQNGDLSRANFEEVPYDFNEISRASDKEMYIGKSFLEHLQLMMREGFNVKSQDVDMEAYSNLRLREIEILTSKSFWSVIRQAGFDLIRFCNAYIIKSRRPAPVKGKPYTLAGVQLGPITGLFNADPTTITTFRNFRGQPIYYKQFEPTTGQERIWDSADVIHIQYNLKTGMVYGTPWVLPVLDDVRLLRRFEEHVDILAGNFAQPLMHWKIGNDAQPVSVDPTTGESEIEKARREFMAAAQEGTLITSHRHDIKTVNTSVGGVDLNPFLIYLRDRVIAGLGLNTISLGQGGTANKATAGQLANEAINRVKDIQEVASDVINRTLLFEIALDSGEKYDPSAAPYLEFTEIDVESQRARENHAIAMYNGNAMTHPELRREMNRHAFTPEDEGMDVNAYTNQRRMELEAKYQVKGETPGARAATVRNQPTNQAGMKATKTKVRKNDALKDLWAESFLLSNTFEAHSGNQLNRGWVEKNVNVYLDKSRQIVHDFIKNVVYDHCSLESVQPPNDEELESLAVSLTDVHLNGSLTSLSKAVLGKEPYSDTREITGLVARMDAIVINALDGIIETLDKSFTEKKDGPVQDD